MRVALLVLVIAAGCGGCGGADEGPYTYEKTGLTELVLTFGSATRPEPAVLKSVLVGLGQRDIQIVRMDDFRVDGVQRPALRAQFALSDWPTPKVREEVAAEIRGAYGSAIEKIAWAGSAIFIRSTAVIDEARLRDIVTAHDLVVRDVHADQDDGTGEYHANVRVGGIDMRVERALEAQLPGMDVVVESAMSVGPQRPRKARSRWPW